MLGAIIGDLAAWTWERDPAFFIEDSLCLMPKSRRLGLLCLALQSLCFVGLLTLGGRLFTNICRFQYQEQRCDKSNARTSFGDLKSKLFLGLLFSSILIFRICLSSTSLNEVPLGMYCRMSLLSNSTWGLSVEQ